MDIKKRIEAAKEAAEIEYQKKMKARAKLDADADDILAGIDLDEIADDEDYIQGKVADIRAADRYAKLRTAAEWLYANCGDIRDVLIEPITPLSSSVHVTLVFRRLSYLNGVPQRVLALMSVLADTFAVICLEDGPVRMSFGVSGVWEE